MKTSLTRCILFLLCFGLVSGLTAQTVYWGDQPGQGDFNTEMNGWTSEVVSGPDTSWTWVADGTVDGGFLAGQGVTINSPTGAEGAMIFNADAYTNGSTGPVPDNFPDYIVDLVSPTIDLSGVPAGTALDIEFYQILFFFFFPQGRTFSSYSVSTDDGLTWSAPVDPNPDSPAAFANSGVDPLNNSRTVGIPFGANAAGSSTVKIKFTIAGNFYYWALDDVRILSRPPEVDVTVSPSWYAVSPNYMVPATQVDQMVFMTDVGNSGGTTAEDVELTVSIEDGSGSELYSGTETYGTLTPDSLDENRVFGAFTPPATVGEYTGTYAVSTSAADVDPDNNELSFNFEVTEEVFAKENGETRAIYSNDNNWDDGIPKSWAYGNHFYIVNGDNQDLHANTASFIIDNANESEGIPLFIKLWKWDAPVDDWMMNPGGGDYTCQPEDRIAVGSATYTIDGSEDDDEFVTVFLNDELSLEPGVPLEDNTHYILMIEMIETGPDDSNVVGLGASDLVDYAPSNFASIEAGAPRFGAMIGLNGSGALSDVAYNRTGFGPEIVPCIRMEVGPRTTISTVNILNDAKVNVFPSPADKELSAEIVLDKEYAEVTVKVVNTLGAIITEKTYDSLQNEIVTFNSSEWASGNYFLQIATAEGVKTKSFIVQH
ncbi:MAG: T9SS type A sorting domain-containing protein [Saprospiraceae bacterium]